MREEYTHRINRVLDYIESNIDKQLSLEKLADVASFSRFHFHRIFAAMVGETTNQFIQRLRVNKAAGQLVGYPKKSVTAIAMDCGFSGSATFARAFKERFGMSASEWRDAYNNNSNNCKMNSNNDQPAGNKSKDYNVSTIYTQNTNQIIWRVEMKDEGKLKVEVEVKDIPEFTVAYIRHTGPYMGDGELFGRLFGQLMQWAGPRGLLASPDMKCLTIYHDDPELVEAEKHRISVCLSVPEDTEVDGEIGKMKMPAGKYAMAHFEIDPAQYGDAWNAVCGGWLPESGYQPADGAVYELYLNNSEEHPEKKHIVEICIPVKPL